MTDNDVMIEVNITLQRDGTVRVDRRLPSGLVTCERALIIGILEAAKSMTLAGIIPMDARK